MAIPYNSNFDGTTAFSDTCYQINCATNLEESITVPGLQNNKYQAVFSYNQSSNVFVRLNSATMIPVGGSVLSQPYSEFRPHKRYVKGGDVIHLVTPDASAYVGISLMSLPS